MAADPLRASNPQLLRLRRMLSDADFHDEWSGDAETRRALTSEWLLAQHVANGKQGHREKYAQNLEDSTESEKRIRVDHAGRYPVELLQNAQDACADARIRGKAWFRVTDTALLVGNQGVPFTADRVVSLVRLGATTKQPGDPKHHTIGYKGIGFTSVLDVSERPQIISHGVAFSLDGILAKEELGRILALPISRAPSRYFPFPLTPTDWEDDAEAVTELLSSGAVTVVRLPFREEMDPSEVRQRLAAVLVPTTLLLMPALDALDCGDGRCWTRTRGRKLAGGQVHHMRSADGERESWLVAERRVPVAAEVVHALEDDVWSKVRDLHLLVGVPWADGQPAPALEQHPSIHAYFPTDDSAGRGILIHGDFFLASNRLRIHSVGAGGTISEAVAQGVVELTGDLAEAFCDERPERMPGLLACLAKQAPPQGFGELVSKLLDEHLAERLILRTVRGRPVTPKQASIVGVDMPLRELTDFTMMLGSIGRLVAPEFEQTARQWLRELGATPITGPDVTLYLTAQHAPSYARAVLAVAGWWRQAWRSAGYTTLERIRILQSTDGEWSRASQLCEPVDGVPALPAGLQRKTYRPPADPAAAKFVEEKLNVDQLDLERSLDLVLGAVSNGSYGRDAQQRQAVHDFAAAVFRQDKAVLAAHESRGLVPVPVRRWRRGPAKEWCEAADVYFSRDWTGTPDLEWLYRRFGKPEFLAVEPPRERRRLSQARDFYSSLGVAAGPRHLEETGTMWNAPNEWRRQDAVQSATRCPDEHPQSAREYRYEILDRLPELLEGIDVREARALVNVLAREQDPFGAEATIACMHSAHRGTGGRRTIGYQRLLLESKAWVPVQGDPLGRDIVRPLEAWVHVNGKALKACLPQAEVAKTAAEKLALPAASKPTAPAVIAALFALHKAYPGLDSAPRDVVEGATLLLQRIEVALSRAGKSAAEVETPPFPVHNAGIPVWADRPIVPDISLPVELPIDVLPPGIWENVGRTFDLPLASTRVDVAIEPVEAADAELRGLTRSDRVGLTALLAAKGADVQTVARRLGRLQVMRCKAIPITFIAGDSTVVQDREVHLDERGEDSARLYVVEPFSEASRATVADMLAAYLGAPEQRETVLLWLAVGEELLSVLAVSPAGMDEAEEAILRYARSEDQGMPARRQASSQPSDRAAPEEPEQPTPRKREPAGHGGATAKSSAVGGGEPPPDPSPIRTTYAPPQSSRPTDAVVIGSDGANVFFAAPPDVGGPIMPSGTRPSGAWGGTGRSGSASVSAETRRAAEESAIYVAKRYAREKLHCVDVRDVQEANKGWDLEFVFEDAWWPVEVKGFGGGANAFILTRNEVAASKTNSLYRVLLVTGTQKGAGEIIEIVNPGAWLVEEDLDAMSWAIRNWRDRATVQNRWDSA
jgi:hypothetical protein